MIMHANNRTLRIQSPSLHSKRFNPSPDLLSTWQLSTWCGQLSFEAEVPGGVPL